MPNGGKPIDLVKVRRGWSRSTGFYTERTYKGTKDAVTAQESNLVQGADSYDHDHDGASHYLIVKYADNVDTNTSETPGAEVRLIGTRITLDLKQHPTFNAIAESEWRKIEAAIRNPQDYLTAGPALQDPDAIELYTLMAKGQRHYISYQPTISRSLTASQRYNFHWDYENIGLVYNNEQLIGELSVPLPPNLKAAFFRIGQIELPNELSSNPDFAYGWLKVYPELSIVAGQKSTLTSDFIYGLWPLSVYPHY